MVIVQPQITATLDVAPPAAMKSEVQGGLMRTFFALGFILLNACGMDSTESTSAGISVKKVAGEKSSNANTPTHCLTECEIPPRAQLDFRELISISKEGCTVTKIQSFVQGNSLDLYYSAKCAGATEVYWTRADLYGNVTAEPIGLTKCRTGTGVRNFVIEDSGLSKLLVYVCHKGSADYTVSAIDLRNGFEVSAPKNVETLNYFSESNFDMWLKYNKPLGLYGYGRGYEFKRLNLDGTPIRGGVSLKSGDTRDVVVENSNWVLLSGTYFPVCSKISGTGQLECNSKKLSIRTDSSLFQDEFETIELDMSQGYAIFSHASCSKEIKTNYAKRSELPHKLLSSVKLNDGYTAVMGRTDRKLTVDVLFEGVELEVASQAVIADFDSDISGELILANDQLLASYVADGRAVVSLSAVNK